MRKRFEVCVLTGGIAISDTPVRAHDLPQPLITEEKEMHQPLSTLAHSCQFKNSQPSWVSIQPVLLQSRTDSPALPIEEIK